MFIIIKKIKILTKYKNIYKKINLLHGLLNSVFILKKKILLIYKKSFKIQFSYLV
jgi:hypothetical protein